MSAETAQCYHQDGEDAQYDEGVGELDSQVIGVTAVRAGDKQCHSHLVLYRQRNSNFETATMRDQILVHFGLPIPGYLVSQIFLFRNSLGAKSNFLLKGIQISQNGREKGVQTHTDRQASRLADR